MQFIPFTAVTRMSGVNYDGNEIRKGAAETMQAYVEKAGGTYSEECANVVQSIATKGGTPLVVAKNHRILGVIYLKDIIKDGVKEKFFYSGIQLPSNVQNRRSICMNSPNLSVFLSASFLKE